MIRQIIYDNQEWFVVKDISKILLLTNITEMLRNIPSINKRKELMLTETRGKQTFCMVNIDGVKQLLHNSRSTNKEKVINMLKLDMNIVYDCKESSYLKIISASFKHLAHCFQFKIDKYRVDMCFTKELLIIECDEFNHEDRCQDYEIERQRVIENFGYKFIRFNPDVENFNVGKVINEIFEMCMNKNK